MKILLFGKTGLLGQALFGVLGQEHEVFGKSREECDICDLGMLKKCIDEAAPDIIVNAAGYAKVDDAEKEKEEAFRVNAEGVSNLAKVAGAKSLSLVHFSTDYVFCGEKRAGYCEDDSPAPLSIYGASKAAGEKEIFENLQKYYLIRTSWLFGPGGKNFVDTMLELAKNSNGKPLTVVNDQIGGPTYTLDLAQAVLRLLKGKTYGIYHIVNSGTCSWHEFAKEIFNQLGLPQEVSPISSEELNRPAKRPKCSILLNTKLPQLRHWKEALREYLQEKTLIL